MSLLIFRALTLILVAANGISGRALWIPRLSSGLHRSDRSGGLHLSHKRPTFEERKKQEREEERLHDLKTFAQDRRKQLRAETESKSRHTGNINNKYHKKRRQIVVGGAGSATTFEEQVGAVVTEMNEILDQTLKLDNLNDQDHKRIERLLKKSMAEISEYERQQARGQVALQKAAKRRMDFIGEEIEASLSQSEKTTTKDKIDDIKSRVAAHYEGKKHTRTSSGQAGLEKSLAAEKEEVLELLAGTIAEIRSVHVPSSSSSSSSSESDVIGSSDDLDSELNAYADEVTKILGDISVIIEQEQIDAKQTRPGSGQAGSEVSAVDKKVEDEDYRRKLATEITAFILDLDLEGAKQASSIAVEESVNDEAQEPKAPKGTESEAQSELQSESESSSTKKVSDRGNPGHKKSRTKQAASKKKKGVYNTPVWRAKLKSNARKQALRRLLNRSDERQLLR